MWQTPKANRVGYALTALFIVGVFALMVKVAFFNWNPETKQFQIRNDLFDDGGAYVSELHVHRDRDWFESQPWFQEIRDQVSSQELHDNWGLHGPRVQYIFKDRFMSAYFKILLWVDDVFVGDIKRTYALTLFAFPLLVLFKFVVLFSLCRRRYHLQLVVWNLTHDLLNVPPIPGSEHSAVQFFLIALGLLFFSDKGRTARTIGWLSLVAACLFNPIPWAPALALIVVLTPASARLWSRLVPKFSLITLAGMVTLALIPLIHLGANLLSSGTAGHHNTSFTLFTRNLVYVDLLCVLMILFIHWAPRWQSDVDSGTLQSFKGLTILLVLGACFISLVSPWIHFEIWENVWRYQRYIAITLLGASVTILGTMGLGTMRAHVNKALVLSFSVLFIGAMFNRIHPGQPLGWSNRIEYVQSFKPEHLPTRDDATAKKPIFWARTPQQVYGYFITKRYEQGPLYLELRSKKYKPQSSPPSP